MSLTAKKLSKSGARGKDLDAIVREQLLIIDEKLHRTTRTWGRNVVVHDLPATSPLPGLDKRDAQRIIYSSILRSLDQRGFETAICLEGEVARIFIVWMTDLGEDEISAMNSVISQHRISSSEIKDFAAGTGARRPSTICKQIGRSSDERGTKQSTVKDSAAAAAAAAEKDAQTATAFRAKPAGLSSAEVDILGAANK